MHLTIKNSAHRQCNMRKCLFKCQLLPPVGQLPGLKKIRENKIFSLDADRIVQKFVFHELFHILIIFKGLLK